jgi:hypothetical protein
VNILAGDTIVIHTEDGRNLRCEVLNVFNTVGGIKIKVQSGHTLLTNVDPGQVIQILKKAGSQ